MCCAPAAIRDEYKRLNGATFKIATIALEKRFNAQEHCDIYKEVETQFLVSSGTGSAGCVTVDITTRHMQNRV